MKGEMEIKSIESSEGEGSRKREGRGGKGL